MCVVTHNITKTVYKTLILLYIEGVQVKLLDMLCAGASGMVPP